MLVLRQCAGKSTDDDA